MSEVKQQEEKKDRGENEGVREVLEELEEKTSYVMVDGVSTSLGDVIQRVLSSEDENERRMGRG